MVRGPQKELLVNHMFAYDFQQWGSVILLKKYKNKRKEDAGYMDALEADCMLYVEFVEMIYMHGMNISIGALHKYIKLAKVKG